jgi:hypothetical protein
MHEIYRQLAHFAIADLHLNLAARAPMAVSRQLLAIATVRAQTVRLPERAGFVLNALAADRAHCANPKLMYLAKRIFTT